MSGKIKYQAILSLNLRRPIAIPDTREPIHNLRFSGIDQYLDMVKPLAVAQDLIQLFGVRDGGSQAGINVRVVVDANHNGVALGKPR